eukprot:Gb_30819 [translate_table: standard]
MMISAILRSILLYGLFTSLLRYLCPKRFELWFARTCSVAEKETNTNTHLSETNTHLSGMEQVKGSSHASAETSVGRDELKRVFSTFDKNGDGMICRAEMRESLEKLGLQIGEEELLSTISKVDANGDGFVDFGEFVVLYESISAHSKDGGGDEGVPGENGVGLEEDEDLVQAFGVFDENGDGLITVEELQSVLSSLGLKEGRTLIECRNMIRNVDVDGDGMINYREFKKMMSSGFGRK